jgi:serine/threonine protein kinase
LISGAFGHKEKAFIEECLQVDPKERKSATELLQKSLFSTDNSTIHSNTLRLTAETLSQRFNELERLMHRYREESQSMVCEDLEEKFSELYLCLSNQLERVEEKSGG